MSEAVHEFGVCRLSVIPIRQEPSDRSEQVSQLLFGDHYEVINQDRKEWLRIRVVFDGYEGWISAKQHHMITAEYAEFIGKADFRVTTDVVSSILYNKVMVPIVIGSIIPISASELFRMEEQFAFNGESKTLGQKRDVEFMLSQARKYLHAPYQWGGKSPFGIDCSGFVQMVFRLNGYTLPRDARDQARTGKPVDFGSEKPGDLAFFHNEKQEIVHVGIVLPDSRIIHASGKVRIDQLTEEGILNAETHNRTHSLKGIQRIIP